MQRLSATFLTSEEQQAVTTAVQEAERRTSGEIVPLIVAASHHYPMARVRGAAFVGLPLALLFTSLLGSSLWLGQQNMYLFLFFFALLYLAIAMVVNSSVTVKRLLLFDHEMREEVKEAALTSFFLEGLSRTREENGILIFVSVLERKVWILGDRGINDRIDPATWDHIVDDLTQGIRGGRQGQALCRAVREVGDILAQHFPHRRDDTDELHNLIIR
ncbi:MAG: TPM domain-containing protein [Desulfopila sp.]